MPCDFSDPKKGDPCRLFTKVRNNEPTKQIQTKNILCLDIPNPQNSWWVGFGSPKRPSQKMFGGEKTPILTRYDGMPIGYASRGRELGFLILGQSLKKRLPSKKDTISSPTKSIKKPNNQVFFVVHF